MRGIYGGTALQQMMYACSAWSNALHQRQATHQEDIQHDVEHPGKSCETHLRRVQTTSKAALDVEASLLPIEQQMWKQGVVTRLISGVKIACTADFQTGTMQLNPTGRYVSTSCQKGGSS